MFNWIKKQFLSFEKSITTDDLEKILAIENITLLDVRTPQEYRIGHIKEAINHPLQSISTYRGQSSKRIYVICQSGMRSRKATKILREKGY